ncbi:activating molecule in BECN1-regulated autophagy protein 1 [Trichonephila inaurata madagascariensis]|uniref:Activating molecule in BECN1-regulated autophagy protein 1 n=1 Tax=Trichonephila inaurata madagascariensis TaxID=2747483 RepID=A0A8X7BQH9_9ARAC|nr:activating molecule in BECN1-regulated autophagy protein 1 [Trichonephila inaurata madagascariensis]
MENNHDEAPGPSGLNSTANDDSDSDIEILVARRLSAPIRRTSRERYSTIENEFLRLYRLDGFKKDLSQAITFDYQYLLNFDCGEPDECPENYRIQAWPFNLDRLPEIHDAEKNVVARECRIFNDSSVDISQDGEKLVAIALDHKHHKLKIAVHSLLPHNLGQLLCTYGPVSNPLSVSISPLSQFVFIGMSNPRLVLKKCCYPDAEVISIRHDQSGMCRAVHFRTFKHIYHDKDRIPIYSITSVRWLPEGIPGFSFATNFGSLVICTPETEGSQNCRRR